MWGLDMATTMSRQQVERLQRLRAKIERQFDLSILAMRLSELLAQATGKY
jgi:hypothetical protein